MSQDFICGGSGKLTPEAEAEIEAFRNHLLTHAANVDDCRFCAERNKRADASLVANLRREVASAHYALREKRYPGVPCPCATCHAHERTRSVGAALDQASEAT